MLNTGKPGITDNLPQTGPAYPKPGKSLPYGFTGGQYIYADAQTRAVLGKDGCRRRAGSALLPNGHKEDIQSDVQYCSHSQKHQRNHGIPQGFQIRAEKIVQSHRRNSPEDQNQILPGDGPNSPGNPHPFQNQVHPQQGKNGQQGGHQDHQQKGSADPPFQALLILSAKA